MISVFVVDDHLVVRQGLRSLLAQYADLQVVMEAENAERALELADNLRADVALVDIRMDGQNGLELARKLRRICPQLSIIILTSYEDDAYLLQAAQAGVHGYLLKSTSAEVLAEAIRAAQRGERRLSPTLAGKALQQLETLSQAQLQLESGLLDQELQLLQLIADGVTNQEVAAKLYLSERTVKRKVQDILTKLGATNRAQAVAEAYKRGLL
ncbi:MAG: response regulator transcription factor [Caldilineaceae bacterium]